MRNKLKSLSDLQMGIIVAASTVIAIIIALILLFSTLSDPKAFDHVLVGIFIIGFVAVFAALFYALHASTKNNPNLKQLKELENQYKHINTTTYRIYDTGSELILLDRKLKFTNKDRQQIKVNKINDVRIYEDSFEKSAVGKSIVGGIAFGMVGAIAGSASRGEQVRRMGIKLFTDEGIFNIITNSMAIKKGSGSYMAASDKIDEVYNMVLKYIKKA